MDSLISAGGPAAATALKLPLAPFVETGDRTRLFYSDMWEYQMMHLVGRGRRCIAYDRRGHGRSGDPGGGYDYDSLADDLASVIETLELAEITLVGHSMAGGEIARYLTRHGSARIARVALVAPTTPFLLRTADNPGGIDPAMFEAMRTDWLRDRPQWLADNAAPFFAPDTSPEMVRWLIGIALGSTLQAWIECNRAVAETDFRAELRRIDVPVLVVHGDADQSAPIELTGRRTAELIPGCRFERYAGAPHGLFITHMARLNADLADFIAS
jgi:pimeloyl-ACP methyl ester carboxylesterase